MPMKTLICASTCATASTFVFFLIGCDSPKQQTISAKEQVPQHERLPIDGRWRDGEFDLVFTNGRLKTLKNGEPFEYPNGPVTHLKPGFVRLEIDSVHAENFHYEWDGEHLMMIFERSGPVYCDPVDEDARRCARQLRSGGP